MKYVDIRTINSGKNLFGIPIPGQSATYQVWAMRDGAGTPVTRAGDKLGLNRKALGLRCPKNYRPPEGPAGEFTHDEAVHVAHQVGRYYLRLGDLVFGYTTVDGLKNDAFFFQKLADQLARRP